MSYIFESTNTIRIILIDISNGSQHGSALDFSGFIDYKPEDESGNFTNINNEVLTNNLGMRMMIDVSILNRSGVNSQTDILGLFVFINLVKTGKYLFKIYPSYDSTMLIDTLDSFICIPEGYYNMEKLHKCLKAGQDIKITFKQNIPNKIFIPKIPSNESGSIPYEQGLV